jgi:hypothetical protein
MFETSPHECECAGSAACFRMPADGIFLGHRKLVEKLIEICCYSFSLRFTHWMFGLKKRDKNTAKQRESMRKQTLCLQTETLKTENGYSV